MAGGAIASWRLQGRDEPTEAPESDQAAQPLESGNVTSADRPDRTEELKSLLASGEERVVFPAGTSAIRETLVIPWHVREIELLAGSVLVMAGDEIALRREGVVDETVVTVRRAVEGESEVVLDGTVPPPGTWMYLCADDWIKVDKSKVGMLRRIVSAEGNTVTVDKPLIRTLVAQPRAHVVTMAPSLRIHGGGAIENADPETNFTNLLRLDFVENPVIEGIELRQCGDAALRVFGTVGGVVDAWIHDCLDGSGHYGYGVSCTSATRDLRVAGRIERVRHAFTTDHGYGAQIRSIAQSGEPEDILVEAVVRDTTSTGIDTHEPGYGITIVPDVAGCGSRRWGGVNIRARNVTVLGGTVGGSNEWGIFVQPSASGTVIRGTAIDGVTAGRGIHCKSDTTIEGGQITGFGASFGLDVDEGVTVTMTDTLIDGINPDEARGIALAGTGSSLSARIVNCAIGVLQARTASANVLDLTYENVSREQVLPKDDS